MSTLSPRPQENTSTQSQPHYYCYACNAEVPIYMAPDPTCQQCNDQFVQEIDAESDPRSFLTGAAEGPRDTYAAEDDDVFDFFGPGLDDRGTGERPSVQTMLQRMFTTMLMPPFNSEEIDQQQQRRQPFDQHLHNQPLMFYGGMVDGNLQFRRMNSDDNSSIDGERGGDGLASTEARGGAAAGASGRAGRGDGDTRTGSFANSLFQMLQNLAMPGDGFVGNLNDYVFTQDALDNIITQLMDQGSGTGPPPATETVIEALPKRRLTDQEFAQQMDCAVCKDEFAQSEQAVELPCAHIFHPGCIKPWLKMNGTCPVCRRAVTGTDQDDGNHGSTSRPPSDNQRTNTTFSQLLENARRMYEQRPSDIMPGTFNAEAEGRSGSSSRNPPPPNNTRNSTHSSPEDPMDID